MGMLSLKDFLVLQEASRIVLGLVFWRNTEMSESHVSLKTNLITAKIDTRVDLIIIVDFQRVNSALVKDSCKPHIYRLTMQHKWRNFWCI